MKATKVLLGAASYLIAAQLLAGEAVFYITEEGSAVRDLAVSVNGQKKLVGSSGFVTFDIAAGKYRVELSQYGEYLGEFEFSTNSASQNAEIQVELVGGEPMADVNLYVPGQEATPAKGKLSGFVQSAETGGGVAGASIVVNGTDIAVVTDRDGSFSLEMPRGEYSLTIAHPNYGKRDVRSVRVMGNINTGLNLSLSMSGSGTIEEVVAVGSYIPTTATAQQRDSSSVLSAIGAEQLSRFGDSSAASALKRVAGVSVVGGQFAVVRGLQGRYISSTLNGSLMPSTDPMRRDVPLDLFPASVLGGINIQKSYTPDLPGDTTGGAIMMETKGLPDEFGTTVSVSGGFNTRTTFNSVGTYKGGSTDWTGMDDGTREVPAYADQLSNGGRTSLQYCSNPELGCLTADQRNRLGASFDHIYDVDSTKAPLTRGFSISHAREFSLLGRDLSYYAAVDYSDEWSARHSARVNDVSETGTYDRTDREIDFSGYLVFGYEDAQNTLMSKTILLRKTEDTVRTSNIYDDTQDQFINDVLLQWVERQYLGQQFSGVHNFGVTTLQSLEWRAGIAETSSYEPDRRSYTALNNQNLFNTLERRFTDLTETAMDVGVDYSADFSLSDYMTLKMKTGLMLSQKSREVEMTRYGVRKLNNDTVDQSQSIETILGGDAFTSGRFGITNLTATTDGYEANDNMLASYVSGELEGDRYSVLAGLRVEDATQELLYPRLASANNSLDSTKVLPVISGRYSLTDNTQLRASVSRTVSRPGITERSASLQYDPQTNNPIQGNPDLQISDIDNLDLRLEHYWSDDESVSLALFMKTVTSPIERTIIEADGSAAKGFTHRNEDKADLSGIEFDFRKTAYTGSVWNTILGGNVSYINSEVFLSEDSQRLEGIKSRELQGQSEWLGNLQLEFDHMPSGQAITLLVNYFSDRIYATGRGYLSPMVEGARTVIDLVYSYEMSENLKLSAKAQNITDEPVTYLRNKNEIERYYEGSKYSLSVNYKF